jgi:hypothetical protein
LTRWFKHLHVCLQDDVAESKVYTRKLEARLEELKGAADLSSKLQVAKGKVRNCHVFAIRDAALAARDAGICIFACRRGEQPTLYTLQCAEALQTSTCNCPICKRFVAVLLLLLSCALQAHDLQQQLVSVTAELEAAREVVQQRDREVDRLNRSATGPAATDSSTRQYQRSSRSLEWHLR